MNIPSIFEKLEKFGNIGAIFLDFTMKTGSWISTPGGIEEGEGGHYRKGPGNQWFRLADSPRGIKSFLRGRGGRGSRYYRSFIENKRKGEEEGEEVDDNEALNNRSATERSSGPSQFKPILTISPDPILVLPSWRPIPWPIAAPHRSTATAFTQSS